MVAAIYAHPARNGHLRRTAGWPLPNNGLPDSMRSRLDMIIDIVDSSSHTGLSYRPGYIFRAKHP
jgi:hypothetical protein